MENGKRFIARGPAYELAWQELQRCEIKPSLEVFDHQLKQERRRDPTLTPQGLARRLADNYHRIPFHTT